MMRIGPGRALSPSRPSDLDFASRKLASSARDAGLLAAPLPARSRLLGTGAADPRHQPIEPAELAPRPRPRRRRCPRARGAAFCAGSVATDEERDPPPQLPGRRSSPARGDSVWLAPLKVRGGDGGAS